MADEMFEIQGKQVSKPVVDELEARSKQLARPESREHTWVTQRQVWYQLTSMAVVDGGEGPLVLKSTPPSFKNIGGIYEQVSLRPALPALTSIKVSKLGELGSTRKATIELTFFTQEQLTRYEPYLMIPGMSIRLEWGWSVGANIKVAPQPLAAGYLNNVEATNQILQQASENPNYDGFQGRVGNFSIQLEGDIWKVTVEIVSAAANVAAKDIATTTNNCKCEVQSADGESKQKEPVDNLKNIFYALHDDPEVGVQEIKKVLSDITPEVYAVEFPGVDRDRDGNEDRSTILGLIDTEGTETFTTETFMSLRTLALLLNRVTGYVSCDDKTKSADGDLVFDTDNGPVYIPSLTEIISVDPYVCILPGQTKLLVERAPTAISNQINDNRSWISRNVFPNLTKIDPKTRIENYKFSTTGGSPSNWNESIGGATVGQVGSILVNTRHIVRVYKDNKTLESLIQSLMTSINDVCGNIWEFEIVDVTDDVKGNISSLTVIDIKQASKNKNIVTNIRSKPQGTDRASVVRGINLTAKLTEEMKTQALYASGPANGSKDPCANKYTLIRTSKNGNTIRVFDKGMEEESGKTNKCVPQTKCLETENCGPEKELSVPDQFFDAIGKVLFKRTDGRVEAAQVAFRNYLAHITTETTKGNPKATTSFCPTLAFPFQLSLTLDGIGGFRWGQYVTTDRLPERYTLSSNGDSFVWQVTTIEHTITPNDWVTEVQTIPRYLPKA